jgi:hypothetical protein
VNGIKTCGWNCENGESCLELFPITFQLHERSIYLLVDKIPILYGQIYCGNDAGNRQSMKGQETIDFAIRVTANSIRALIFAIADGIYRGTKAATMFAANFPDRDHFCEVLTASRGKFCPFRGGGYGANGLDFPGIAAQS